MKRIVTMMCALVVLSVSAIAGESVEAKNKTACEKFIQEVYNQKKLDRIPAYVAESFVDRSPGAPADAKGPEFVRKQAEGSLALFPDLTFQTQRMVAEGDLVTIHWSSTGTSAPNEKRGDAGGRKVTVEGISIFRLENGKVVESWDIVDRLAMFRQLGFKITPPEAAKN